jgi:hypothetical protein
MYAAGRMHYQLLAIYGAPSGVDQTLELFLGAIIVLDPQLVSVVLERNEGIQRASDHIDS